MKFCGFFEQISTDPENLRAIMIEKTVVRRDIPILIALDGDTRHAMVAMSLDTVSQQGFKRLSISTRRPAAGEKFGRSVI